MKTLIVLLSLLGIAVSAHAEIKATESKAAVEAVLANALSSPRNAPAILGLAILDNPDLLVPLVTAAATALPDQTVEVVRVALKMAPKRALEIVRAAIVAQPKLAPEVALMATLLVPQLGSEINKLAFELAPDEMRARSRTVQFAPVNEPLTSRGASAAPATPPSFPAQPIRPDLVSPSS